MPDSGQGGSPLTASARAVRRRAKLGGRLAIRRHLAEPELCGLQRNEEKTRVSFCGASASQRSSSVRLRKSFSPEARWVA